MSYPDSNNPLADKKLLVGIVLIVGFMMGWQYFLSKRYPSVGQGDAKAVRPAADPVNGATTPTVTSDVARPSDLSVATDTIKPESLFSYEDNKVRFTVTSRGLGLKEFVRKDYKDAQGEQIRLGLSSVGSLFEARLGSSTAPINFAVREIEKGVFEGTAQTPAGQIVRLLKFNSEKEAFENTMTVTGATAELTRGLGLLIPDSIRDAGTSSWLVPSYHHQDFFVDHGGSTDTVSINHSKENVTKEFQNVSLVSAGDQYFSSAILDQSPISPDVTLRVDLNGKVAAANLVYKPVQVSGAVVFKEMLYAGPRSIDVLQNIDPAMAALINFGWLSVIGKPLLWVMKWFFSIVGNWGLAIILLTVMVRFIVLPFNLLSVRSMRAMQKIQPLMKEVRERYKDDPMAQQRETMALMKEHKANPLGGCLPMLVQIPVFFALYRVISVSVELYQAPFAGWIHDLSSHDPFYVLPVLMGLTMFVQSKMTPTAMDPAQAKVMQYLPLVFTVFMLQLPAGLTLYMVISALFGITQQYFVLKSAPAPVPAK